MTPNVVQHLAEGTHVTLRPHGDSMRPLINSRDEITIAPADIDDLRVGDVVLARVRGRLMCHLISAIDGDRIQISNNHGHVNGWTHRSKVYGAVIAVEGETAPWHRNR